MEKPLISVIVPVHNVEQYLSECIESILKQTHTNLEVIVVNDHSPGNPKKIIDAFKDKRVRIIELATNQGLFRARIEGMIVAKGDYITHIDGDDFIAIDYIEKLVLRAAQTKADIVMGEFIKFVEESGDKYIHNTLSELAFDDVITGGNEILSKLIAKNNFFWEVCGKLYKKTVVKKTLSHLKRIDKHIIMGEDMLFNFHAFVFSRVFARAEFAFYIYRQNETSITAKSADKDKKKKVLEDLIFVTDTVEAFLRKQGAYSQHSTDYKILRNQQAAKHYLEINQYFKKDKELLLLAESLSHDKRGLSKEVSAQEYIFVDDVELLKQELASMNSTKVSIQKVLSNLRRKLKSLI
ncbi:MAG TPA: glycosyltransferase family 2 protein [Candidatus Saccharibacteria bacterium]|nr:glycosyltransferase family 2 protein [Candidatus Saccharibacteria bacterium]